MKQTNKKQTIPLKSNIKPLYHTSIHFVLAMLANEIRQEREIKNITSTKEKLELSLLSYNGFLCRKPKIIYTEFITIN